MKTLFATSPDGTRIAYDRNGVGPAIIQLHGGGSNRQEWHEVGYVERLRDHFTVIPFDLRGHGESGLPTDPADYAIDKMIQDVLAVADACGVDRFTLWGMSYGAKIARYAAIQSDRVVRLVLMSAQLGLGVSGRLRQDAIDFCVHWPPILEARRQGVLDPAMLSTDDQDLLDRMNVPVMLGWVRAMLDWPAIEPADFRCPTLWLIGSEDAPAMDSLRQYETALKGSWVQARILEGLNHEQVFEAIDEVFPILLAFTRSG
jgi:pimeloyl-ACP methyl ester carboxylesterase